jgi:hypothetical protein
MYGLILGDSLKSQLAGTKFYFIDSQMNSAVGFSISPVITKSFSYN